MTHRRALLAGFSTALLLGLAWGCSAADNADGAFAGNAGSNGIAEAGQEAQVLSPDGSMDDDDSGVVLNALCGKQHSCIPDAPNSCAHYLPPTAPNEDASLTPGPEPSDGARAGASGEGGAGGASSADGGTSSLSDAAGASGAAGQAGASGDGGGAGAPPVAPAKYGCQVQRIAGAPKTVTSECAVAGLGGDKAPCLTSSDCLPGFGCVGDQNAGLCQAFCCESADSCAQGTYCAERPLRDAVINALPKGSTATGSTLLIPVCVPAENCDLGAPYPCTVGTQCACKAGTACLVVRSDGTTTCAVPGAGKVGEACPCAWGHVCSAATNQCLQLCYTRGTPSCGDGKCQSASELPDGWGVCVGVTPSGG